MGQPSVSRHDALTTYRVLRVTMVALVALLAASFALLICSTGQRESSISAYYFTATHAVFIAAVCAIGACLIVYNGNTASEETILDVSGGLAFVVAFVPTDPDGMQVQLPTKADPFTGSANNLVATAIALVVGLTLYGAVNRWKAWHRVAPTGEAFDTTEELAAPPASNPFLRFADRWNGPIDRCVTKISDFATEHRLATWILPTLWLSFLALRGAWLLVTGGSYKDWAHGYAAVGMFGGIVLVAIYYAFWAMSTSSRPGAKIYGLLYMLIAGLMLSFLAYTAIHKWQAHAEVDIFKAEVVIIALFAVFWIIQTADLWEDEDKYRQVPDSRSSQ